jgi:hypothetical protein
MWERDWASLERGLLHDVFTRLLADADVASFRHVCRGWRAAAAVAGALVPGPWFVLRSAADGVSGHGAFVRPAGRRRVRRVRFDAAKAPLCASRGWLAVDDGGRLLLREPISRAEVPLPAFEDPEYQLTDIFLSDDPLDAPGRWAAFAFFKMKHVHYAGHVLAFCRPGDEGWAQFDDFDMDGPYARFYLGLEFFRGRAYVIVGVNCRIAVCDLDARTLVPSSVTLIHMMEWQWQEAEVHLVECGGDLLVAAVSHYEERMPLSCCARRRPRRKVGVRVVKVEFAAAGGGPMPVTLSEVEGTGDYALFVAPRGHAFALPASGFPSVRPSCVYHFDTKMTTKSVSGMIVTDLLDHTPHQHRPLRKLPLAGKWHPLSWFRPRCPSFDTTPARRRWIFA